MRKIIAIVASLAMMSIMVPGATAETVNSTYSVASMGIIICSGPPEGDICEDNGIAPVGGFRADPAGSGYSQVTLTIDDDNFDNTFFSVCVYWDDHSICGDHENDVSASGCGSTVVTSEHGISNAQKVSGFVYIVRADADTLEVCLGSSGQAVAVYS